MNMRNFVMREKESRDYLISEKNAQIEIRDGFNSNRVIQHYTESRKVIIYIPEGWQKTITVEVNSGTICCHQREPYRGLRLSVKKGEILYGEDRSRSHPSSATPSPHSDLSRLRAL